jgi:hypothetical protein
MTDTNFPQLALHGLDDLNTTMPYTNGEILAKAMSLLVWNTHAASFNRGWWHDPITGLSLIPGVLDTNGERGYFEQRPAEPDLVKAWFPYVVGTKIALIHSEISEALEAYRVDAVDDKIPMPGITAELTDAVIRIGDLLGCLQIATAMDYIEVPPSYLDLGVENYRELYDMGKAFLLKTPVNAARPDHDIANRAKPGGKKF